MFSLKPAFDVFFVKIWRTESITCCLQTSPKHCLTQRPSTTWHRGHIFRGLSWPARSYGNRFQQKQPTTNFYSELMLEPVVWRSYQKQVCVHYRSASIRTAIWPDHSLFMYIMLYFQYTLEISLNWRSAGTGIWLLIHCLLLFDVDTVEWYSALILSFTVKLLTGFALRRMKKIIQFSIYLNAKINMFESRQL